MATTAAPTNVSGVCNNTLSIA
ncbi:hypothetical protein QFX20_18530 [Lampropedia aestuarii]|nr:hypothetical protein [Lampropedia aestuarii]MDH5859257.1 hypothetical protein [Lampropedia aestuarii]